MGTSIAEAMQELGKKRALSSLAQFANEQKEKGKELRDRIACVTEYRDGLIAKRDHKASIIPLRPHEERMWESKIAQANATIDALNAELATTEW
jgi:uncharacterized coiled-coil DUF342 family protein